MRKVLVALAVIVFLACPESVEGAKKRPPRGGGGTPTRRISTATRGIKTSVRFRSDRRALLLIFSSFNSNIVSVTYALTYTSNGIPRGAQSTLIAATGESQRELLFGTCSGGVCRYHHNITNARLVIDTKLKSGLTIRKPYRIKV